MKRALPLLLLAALPAMAQSNSVALAWTAPTVYGDGTPITAPLTYFVYQGVQGQAKVKLAAPVLLTTATLSAGLLSGKTYCWQLSASDDGTALREGALSNEACKTFQLPITPPPIGLTAK